MADKGVCQLGFCVNLPAVWALLETAKCRKGVAGMSWLSLRRFFRVHWKWVVTTLVSLFGFVIERVVLSLFPSFFEVKLLLGPSLWVLLFVVVAFAAAGVVFFVFIPFLGELAVWLFRPALVGTKRRKFCDLLPEVECCLGFLGKDYGEQAASVSAGDVLESFGLPAPFSSRVQYKSLMMRLEVLFSKLRKLGLRVPTSVEIDSVGDLGRMGEYLGQIEVCMRACDLDSAREIDPP